jgi:hypothetical protein
MLFLPRIHCNQGRILLQPRSYSLQLGHILCNQANIHSCILCNHLFQGGVPLHFSLQFNAIFHTIVNVKLHKLVS